MKKFQFRLATVERVRQIQDDLARGELLAANRQLQLAAAAVASRAQEAEDRSLPATTMTSEAFALHRFTIESAFEAVRWAQRDEYAAAEVVAERRAEWVATNTRLRAVERLHERAREEHVTEVRKDADRTADEIATTRFRERSAVR